MPDNRLELVVQVDVDKANASIKSINTGLSNLESTASNAARGASRGIDGLTLSVVKGATAANLLTGAFERVVGWVREYTVESAKLAARNETLAVVNAQLARANDYNGDAIERLVGRVKNLGITTQAARDTVNKMIAAQLDLSRTTDLARLAQDAAVVAGQNSSEALQGIIHGITTQQIEVLRTYGINVQFEREFTAARARLGRDLTDSERKNIAFQKVLGEAPKIAGAYEASLGTVGKQIASLSRFTEEAKAAIGEQFLPELRKMIVGLTDLAKWAKENANTLALWAKGIGAAAIGAAIGQFISWIAGAKKAVEALTITLARNPLTAAAIAATVAGTALYEMYQDSKQLEEQLKRQNAESAETAKIFYLIGERGKTVQDLQKMGYSIDQIRRSFAGAKEGAQDFMASFDASEFANRIKIVNQKELEQIRKQAAEELARDIRKKQGEIERETRESALAAERALIAGPGRALQEMQDKARKLTVFVDSKGAEHAVRLTAQTRENIERELQARVVAIQRESVAQTLQVYREEYEQRLQLDSELYAQRLQYSLDAAAKDIEHLERVYAFEEDRAGYVRDANLRMVEATDARTLEQKIAVEQRKAQIEIDHLETVHEIKQRLFDMETSRMVMDEESHLRRLGLRAEEINQRIAHLTQQRETLRQHLAEQTDTAIEAAQQSAANRQVDLVRNHNQQMFDSFKRQAEGVFDALLAKSGSVWSAIGNSLKTALLTAIKDVVTSRVAAMLMQMFTGTQVSMMPASAGGGRLGQLGGLLGIGAAPVFGAGSIATPTFTSHAGGSGAEMLSKAGLAGLLPGLKSFAGIENSIQIAPGVATTWQAATLFQKIGAIARSNAPLLGGGLLAMQGLRQGGLSGMAMSTAGGALIGFKFGGPLGAAIGAGAGAVAGLLRLFVKGAEQKAREKVRAVYGVDISDKALLKQIVDTAKQGFGGNLDVAIRSPQIRDLVELYAMSTGRRTTSRVDVMRPADLIQSGSQLFQAPTYVNSSPLVVQSKLPSFAAVAQQPTTVSLSLQLDGRATTDIMEGRAVHAVVNNPRAVSDASQSARLASVNRTKERAASWEPLTTIG